MDKRIIHGSWPGLIILLALSILPAQSSRAGQAPARQKALLSKAPGLRAEVLGRALEAMERARVRGLTRKHILTIIDYSLPSTARRLWVFDLTSQELLFHELVAHGRGSGENKARAFSNRAGSLMTSLGLFRTGETYEGKHGHSLKLEGLEPGFNDRAAERAIVIHGAWYVSEAFAREHGRLGRSWGCPALDERIATKLIDRIAGGSLVFAYYPDPDWLARSAFLNRP